MRKSSVGRQSSSNPVRVSMLERDDRNTGRSDGKKTQKSKPSIVVDNSQIPRPKIRSSSSERASIRRSTLKPLGKTPLRQQHLVTQPVRISNVATPVYSTSVPRASSSRVHPDLPSGIRGRSPSAERASGFGAKGPRKDNRPLADKAYQSIMLGKIDQYFYMIQQTCLLNSNGSLRPITLKIFVEASNCLVKLLDIKQELTIANYMDEVPKIAKKLHYPGVVTKSWLKTANTMHSWPQVLGWLSWLCEVCDAKDKAELAFSVDKIPFTGKLEEQEPKRCTFRAIQNMYNAWNDMKLDEEAALMSKHVYEMNKQHGDMDKAIQEEQRLLEQEMASLESTNQQEIELDEDNNRAKEILENLKHEESKELDTIKSMEKCLNRVKHEKEQLNIKCDTLKDEIEKDISEQNKMIIIVQNQKMTVEQRDDIIKQCSEVQNNIDQLGNHIKDIENEMYALDLKVANSNQSLYKAVLAYNKDIVLHLDCVSGVDLVALKVPETNMLHPDFLDILKNKETALLNVKDNIRKQCEQGESAVDANSNELDALEDKLKALREENKDYVEKAHEQKLCIQQIQNETKKTEINLKEHIKQLQNDIAQLEQSMPDVEAATNELAEAKDKYAAVVRRSEFVEKRMERFFKQFYQIISYHRNDLDIILKKMIEA